MWRALIVAVETTQIEAFRDQSDQPRLVAGAVEYVRWLVDREGGGLLPSAVRMLCSTAGADSERQLADLQNEYPGIHLDGPPTVESLKAAVAGMSVAHGDLVVYWASHGVSDDKAGRPASQWLVLSNDNRISLFNLLSWLVERLQPYRVVGVVDACRRSSKGINPATLGGRHQFPVEKMWQEQTPPCQLFYACSHDERAYATQDQGGEFTAELLKQLRAPGLAQAERGPWLPEEQLNEVYGQLRRWGRKAGQHPYFNLIEDDSDRSLRPATPQGLSDSVWRELRDRTHKGGAVETGVLLSVFNEIRPAAAELGAVAGRSGLGEYLDAMAAYGGDALVGAQPLVLRFLYALTQRPPSETNLDPELLDWLDRENWWTYEPALKVAFDKRRAELYRESSQGTYLVVELQPPRTPASAREQPPPVRTFRCRLTLFRGSDPHLLAAPEQPLPIRDGVSGGAAGSGEYTDIARWLTDTLKRIDTHHEVELADPAGMHLTLSADEMDALTVEFVVPRELLGAGFGKWEMDDGRELRSVFAVQLRDNGHDRTKAERVRRSRAKRLADTGGDLTELATGWVVCDNRNGSVAIDARIQDHPYVIFTFPAVDEDRDGTPWKDSTPFATLLKLGVPAVLWPDEGCNLNHAERAAAIAANPGLMKWCSTILMPAAYPGLLKQKRDLRPRIFVRDVNRDVPRPELFAGLNLFYDDGTRTEARLVAP